MKTLDSYDLDVGLIKIDVEGAESRVLKGALGTIRKNKPVIMLETGDPNRVELLEMLEYRRLFYHHNDKALRETGANFNEFWIHSDFIDAKC